MSTQSTLKFPYQAIPPAMAPSLGVSQGTPVFRMLKLLPGTGGAVYARQPVAVCETWRAACALADRMNEEMKR
jgi:hypothetical protein